jgi:hypothetical protein
MKLFVNRSFLVLLISIPLILLVSLSKPNSIQSIYKVENDRFWTYKVHSGNKYNMLILGDSRVYRGISPSVINKEITDISICNFGFSSGKLNSEIYNEAYKRMDLAVGKKIVLIGISPVSLIEEENDQLHEILKYTRSEIFDKIYVNFISAKFLTPLKPSDFLKVKNEKDALIIKETFYDNGWVSTSSNQTNHSEYLILYRKIWESKKVSQKRLNDLYHTVGEWTKEGIRVFAFRVPSSEEMDNLENDLSGFNETDCKSNIILNGGEWLDLKDKYTRYQSYDGSHLDDKSAILLSGDLAVEIKRKILANR